MAERRLAASALRFWHTLSSSLLGGEVHYRGRLHIVGQLSDCVVMSEDLPCHGP